MAPDLRTLFQLEPHPGPDPLELFISDRLYEGGVWSAHQSPDGIVHIRVLEAEPERLRICGRIFEISQSLHPFWLELERDASGPGVSWALYFDVVAETARRARDAIDVFDHASAITWRVALAGNAEIRDGTLVAVVGQSLDA